MRPRNHSSLPKGIPKTKLQGSAPSSHNILQSQSCLLAKNRFSVNGLAVVHGRLIILVDCSAISSAKINSCPLGRGQQQFVHPRSEVFELFDLLEDRGIFCFLTIVRCCRALIARFRVAAIGGVSDCLRRRNATSSGGSTLLGEAVSPLMSLSGTAR